jgi:transcriptional antiterminator RfaH
MHLEETAWFCVRTRHKYERVAAANLQRLGLDMFYPRFTARRLVRGKVVRVTESLFPNYILARFAFPSRLDQVRYAFGVKEVVRFGNRWPTVPEALVADLRVHLGGEPADTAEELVVGDQVIIAVGVCAGQTATVQAVMPARQRLQVLFDILGRSIRLELPLEQVVSASPNAFSRVRTRGCSDPVAIVRT